MKAIKHNKLYRDTYTNAFKGLTLQLQRSFEGFNKRMEAVKLETAGKRKGGFQDIA